ncbi:MAG TPA: hypothetical protein VKV33_07605 [Streptosporangiaceae bacterium]|nr:hypothetical protein [Streptosporangiaceae bacterium]
MAKHDVDPVFRALVRSINESGQAVVPVTLTVHGTVLRGSLVSEARYFTDLAERVPMMSALEPSSGLLGKDYVKDVESESGHFLHLRAEGMDGDGDGLWRIAIADVDAWSLPRAEGVAESEGKGPFARLVSG